MLLHPSTTTKARKTTPANARGRGATTNTPNRFEPLHIEPDTVEPEEEDFERRQPTEYFDDASRSILASNNSPDVGFKYSLNPYRGCSHGCAYCYARPTHEYLGFSAGLDFETKILVKRNAPDLLRDTFLKKSWVPQAVALSGNTDCYQPVERQLEITRRCLEVFLEFRNPVTIITKNGLVARDVDLLQQLAEYELVHVTLSITSLKPALIGVLEPGTSRPQQRLAAVGKLAAAGIPVGINLAPLIPGLNDEEVPAILEAASQAGAQWAHYIMVRLPGAVRPLFLEWLERHMPDRAGKIHSRLRKVRDGDLTDPRFESRMRGEGELADLISRFFTLARRRYDLDGHDRELATEHFRRHGHQQLDLF